MAVDVSCYSSSPRSSSSTFSRPSSCASESLWDFSEITIYTPTVSDRLRELINDPRSWDNYRDSAWPAHVWTDSAAEAYIYLHWEEVSKHLNRYKAKLFALAVFEVAARGLVNLVTVEGQLQDRRIPMGICVEVNMEACILRPPKNRLLRSLLEHCENMKQKKVGNCDYDIGLALATAVSNAGYVCLAELYDSFDLESELKELLDFPRSSFLKRTFRAMHRKDLNGTRLSSKVEKKRQEIGRWAACLREEITAYRSMSRDACPGVEEDLHLRIATVLYAAGPLILLSKDRYVSVKQMDRFDALGCGQPQLLSANLLERILEDLKQHCGGKRSRFTMPEWSHGIGPFAKPSIAVQSDALA
mmetsp:Transcript_10302/g.18008  ORF Transcript_10302/g.18008 Transcript_10302/m.18008 type:complete len:359 (-) Transcript_10302:669-1745(-)|eukprot:CAMPEP_0196653986 /NCGR_PEP_ID=MMETSP1086-20130531/3654_1 /TAXON_ID=77921 /ORGANISM="Cyanoptyche  gloeocystis , Strain SAG4.97" /LENGTH=358 /DNA_ID=CAMNT_0041985471 /DNA_START=133 /DNA_END=1209 /DNA_ORIENTATION=-